VNRGTPQIFEVPPIISGMAKAIYGRQIWHIYSEGTCEQKPIKNLGENGAWAYPGTAQISCVPPIISETDKATNFKFGRSIQRVHPNKSPLKF